MDFSHEHMYTHVITDTIRLVCGMATIHYLSVRIKKSQLVV